MGSSVKSRMLVGVSLLVLPGGACSEADVMNGAQAGRASTAGDSKGGAGARSNSAGESSGGTGGQAGEGGAKAEGKDCDADAGAERPMPRTASDSTCGVDAAPRWKLFVYDGSALVAKPARSHSQGNNQFVIIDLEGSVTGAGRGLPSELNPPPEGEAGLDSDVRYLRVQAQGRTFTLVSYGIADFDASVAEGTAVKFSHHDLTRGHFYLPVGPIETSLRTQQRMVLHYAQASTTPTAPEAFEAKPGKDYCADHDACHSWTGNALEVTDAQGERVSLKPGESGTLTDITVYAGTTRVEGAGGGQPDGCSLTCADISTLAFSEYLLVHKPSD